MKWSFMFAFRLINEFADIFQYMITTLFLWSMVTIWVALLTIQIGIVEYIWLSSAFFGQTWTFFWSCCWKLQLHHNHNLAVLFITMTEIFYSFGVVFVACELGQRINIPYDECSEMVEQFDWHSFPAEIQRLLPLTINFTQQLTWNVLAVRH